jgi:hypothetical protein
MTTENDIELKEEIAEYAEIGEDLKPGQTRVQAIEADAKVKRFKNSHTFLFEHNSALDKRVFSGTITIKRLNIGELARAETEIARRNTGLNPSDPISFFNERLITVTSRVVDGPDWAKNVENSDELHDPLVVQRLWEEVQKYENSFR